MSENKFHNVTPDQRNIPSHPSSNVRPGITPVRLDHEKSDPEVHHSAPNAGMLGSTSIKVTRVDLHVGSAVED